MADDAEPPRKYYDLKPRDFERVNPAAPQPGPPPPAMPTSPAFDPAIPIKLNEVIAAANTPGPALTNTPRATTAVHAILADNVARETAAGLNELAPQPKRPNRRLRDYVLLMVATNVPLFLAGMSGLHSGNVILAASGLGGVGLCSGGITWVMWVVMDKY